MPRLASPAVPLVYPEPDLKAALELVTEMMQIDGTSGRETAIVKFIIAKLRKLGVPAAAIQTDDMAKRSPIGGEIGNLIVKLPGTQRKPRRMLMAHVDTVPVCLGSQPVRDGEHLKSKNGTSGIGADDRAGAAVILTALKTLLASKRPYPPLTFFWPVQEEVGLFGARHVTLGLLGKPKLAFNWDGGIPEKVTIGATGAYRMTIEIDGLASHAGAHPELGVSAITIASLAVAELAREGWHGLVQKGKHTGTSNVGVIRGGEATNVVTPRVEIRAEARSHDPEFRREIVKAFEAAFAKAAAEVKSKLNVPGRITFHSRLDYEAFKLADDEPCVLAAEAAIQSLGLTPLRAISNGGLDANWMTERGIPTVTLGCGQEMPHTVTERLHIPSFEAACRIATRLACG